MLDAGRVHAILETDYGYYAKDQIAYEHLGRSIPSTATILDQSLAGVTCVLDIGCGRADTLRRNASRITLGVGLDDEQAHLTIASNALAASGVSNVHLILAKARSLPFADDRFDFVFSERGPLAFNDGNLIEALRVLRPGGRIFVETLGELNHCEVRCAFERTDIPITSGLVHLTLEADRFARLHVKTEMLASRLEKLRFANVYDWLTYQCSVWRYLGNTIPTDLQLFEQFNAIHADPDGRIEITYHTILLVGAKH